MEPLNGSTPDPEFEIRDLNQMPVVEGTRSWVLTPAARRARPRNGLLTELLRAVHLLPGPASRSTRDW
jgi:hypothetical protein